MIRLYIAILVLISKLSLAQDVHFSQFKKTKSLINPSLIVAQNHDVQMLLQRRSQWSNVSIPFNTFAASINVKEVWKELSLGATIINDLAGDSRFTTKGISFSLAKSVNYNRNTLSLGVQAAYYHRSINYDALFFLETESFQSTKISFFDCGLGISNFVKLTKNSDLSIGFSLYHLNTPKQSLTSNSEVLLMPKYIFHSTYHTEIGTRIGLFPTFYMSSQNQDKEFIAGSSLQYELSNATILKSGIYRRIKDAFFITLGVQKSDFELMISHDINTSSLSRASKYVGGVEFSLTYGWNFSNEKKQLPERICPKYL